MQCYKVLKSQIQRKGIASASFCALLMSVKNSLTIHSPHHSKPYCPILCTLELFIVSRDKSCSALVNNDMFLTWTKCYL